MPYHFFLNDCLPPVATNIHDTVLSFFDNYKKLYAAQRLRTGEMYLSEDYYTLKVCSVRLADIINGVTDRDQKVWILSILSKAKVIDTLMDDINDSDDTDIYANATFNGNDATNLVIAAKTDLIIASLPIQPCLQTDQLTINLTRPSTVSQLIVDNFYGINHQYIIDKYADLKFETKLEELYLMLGGKERVKVSEDFISSWNLLGQMHQTAIIKRFKLASEKEMLFPPRGDDDLIKYDRNGTGVYELRFKSGKRIYFGYRNNIFYIALYATKSKPNGSDQAADFKRAEFIIDHLEQTYSQK